MYPTISDNPQIQAEYEAMRHAGQAHGMAEILAMRKPPGAKTDRELFLGTGTLADQFKGEEDVLKKLVANSKRLGYHPHYTDLYCPALVPLGEKPGHPDAFIPASEGSHHVRRVCEKNNMDCHGLVEVKSPTLDPKPVVKRQPISAPESGRHPIEPISKYPKLLKQ